MRKSSTKAEADTARRTRVLAALGAFFVIASFGLMLRESLMTGKRVAQLSIAIDEILPSTHGHFVSLVIENRGNATAAAVVVQGTLTRTGKAVETSQLTVDYVAAGSRRDIALFFTNDPRLGDLAVRPLGYVEP